MPELISILEDYKSHNDYLKLKNDLQELIKPKQMKEPLQKIGEGLIPSQSKRPPLVKTKQ